ncbi:MAG TPA: DUF2066 domain-containing protein [Pseudomonas xinjiangensis]|uniref:DUF2066 domain-containing protein n=2 Tax=root TaxID=1 RepID=A0A7V1BN29_9GAMM|nr:DUF2066 domain-containing protein [Halopseudomonas xinjiangensis]HEC47974.1 DUF2066 domain-containing protein [Halopseudomonas xinjiangensis]
MFSLRPVVFFCLCVLVVAPLQLSAAVLESLYRVEQPQLEDEPRDETLRKATQVMFKRIAGEEVDFTKGPLAEALKDPRSLMRRIGGEDGVVDVQFEPSALRELMASAQLSMLGRNRPGVLVWAVEPQMLGDELLNQGGANAELLRAAAAHRAVALSFPLGDLEDRSRISEAEIREQDRASLLQASERYSAEGTLAVVLASQGEQAQITWTFWLNDEEYSGRIAESEPAAAVDALMRAVAAAVFGQYAVPAVSNDQLSSYKLIVQDVNSAEDYALLQRMLQQLGSQSVPQVLAVDADRVTVRLNFPGDEAQLERMLKLDRRLVRTSAPEMTVAEQAPVLLPVPDQPSAPHEADAGNMAADPISEAPTAPQVIPVAVEPDPGTLYYRWR